MTTTMSGTTQQYTESTFNWAKTAVLTILIIALVAFEIFNFDTTQYALGNLLGDVTFFGIRWAVIMAIAFCGIDFAGLIRILSGGREVGNEVWYLVAAWLLGATMNAVMTWYAVTLTLLNHTIGNEVVSRALLLKYVPIFIALLVWLTRILFIGTMTVAFEKRSPPPAQARAPVRQRLYAASLREQEEEG